MGNPVHFEIIGWMNITLVYPTQKILNYRVKELSHRGFSPILPLRIHSTFITVESKAISAPLIDWI